VKLNPKQPHVFLTAKAEPPKVRTIDAKPVELNPTFDQVKVDMPTNQPKRPKEDVKVGNLGSGSAAPATVVAPVNKVQTGGFGDPNGLPGKGDPNKATNVNRLGFRFYRVDPYGNGRVEQWNARHGSTGFGNARFSSAQRWKARHGRPADGDQTVAAEAPKKASGNEGTRHR
jgi:hypothetical protein